MLLGALWAMGCQRDAARTNDPSLRVVATTTMLADLARQLLPESVEVLSLVPVGADPHVWQPRPSDARRVRQADVVIRNGLYLEGWIDGLLDNAGGDRKTVTASRRVTPLADPEDRDGADPHFWFDVQLWIEAANEVRDELRPLLTPDDRRILDQRHAAYVQELRALHVWVQDRIDSIPHSHRLLVTSHDAFGYFGRAYGIPVRGVQGMSTGQEAGQRDLVELIRLVRRQAVPALFVETSVHPGLLEQIAAETGVRVAGPLYSDSLGPADGEAATYVTMVRANVAMIVEALGGRFEEFRLAHGS
jgi:ABC-type Zn uptake system ZnuABC Zn-binding protein ZnuA